MTDAPACRRGEVIDGRYRLLELLGRGGIGETFRALRLDDEQEVAIKELSLRRMEDWTTLKLFGREARVLAQLSHPSIPRCIDAFSVEREGDQRYYLVQDLAPGDDLARAVAAGWRPNEEDVRRVATQVLGVLDYLHGLSPPVIHRDIKPQNLIRGDSGQLFLVDFGSVRDAYTDTVLGGSTVVGTFGYMAPEQGHGRASPSSDLYGLGGTLVFLLAGKHPSELPRRRMKLDFRQHARVSPGFARWLDRMLDPVAERRFASAQQALQALDAHATARLLSGSRWPLLLPAVALVAVLVVGILRRTDDTTPASPAAVSRPDGTAAARSSRGSGMLQLLRSSWRRLLAAEPPAVRRELREAAALLRRPPRWWWRGMKAMATLRDHRSRSSLPLLLELVLAHDYRPETTGRAARMLVILSGQRAAMPLWHAGERGERRYPIYDEKLRCKGRRADFDHLHATECEERVRLHAELVRWWRPRADEIEVDLSRMGRKRQLTALRAMSRLRGRLPYVERAHRIASYMGLAVASQKVEINGTLGHFSRRDWYATEKLPPSLLAPLLAIAADLPIHWDAITLLSELYRAGNAPQLARLVSDSKQPAALRLVALLALRRAGNTPPPALLFSLARGAADRRLRVPAVLALRYFDSERSEKLLLELCRHENIELRTAALIGLLHDGSQLSYHVEPSLPLVSALLPRSKDRHEALAALRLLSCLGKSTHLGKSAERDKRKTIYTSVERYARALLAEPASGQRADRLLDALREFRRVTGQRFELPLRHASGLLIDYEQPSYVPLLRRKLHQQLAAWRQSWRRAHVR